MFMHRYLEAGEQSNPLSTERHAGKPSTSSVHISIVGVTVGGEGWSPGGSRTDRYGRGLSGGFFQFRVIRPCLKYQSAHFP